MATICSKCGEELLGSVNRCWKCGTEYQASPDNEIPPVCRGPVLPQYLHLGNELTEEEFPQVIVAETVEDNPDTASESEVAVVEESEQVAGSATVNSGQATVVGNPFQKEEASSDASSPSMTKTYIIISGLSVLAMIFSFVSVLAVPFAVVAMAIAIWNLNNRQGTLTWICLLLAVLAFGMTSIRLAIFIYFLLFQVSPFNTQAIYM